MEWKRGFKVEVVLALSLLLIITFVYATPDGASSVSYIKNSTGTADNGTMVNGTPGSGQDSDNPNKAGSYIYTVNLEGTTQNSRWKGYVGNVTGTLVLDDADGYTLYDWTITTSLSGEVYATRTAGTVNWTNINCSYLNSTYWEMVYLNHTNANDNISTTFNDTDNKAFYVGNRLISANTCPTINLHVNDSSDLEGTDYFEEILLYDGGYDGVNSTNMTEWNNTDTGPSNVNLRNVVYAAILEENKFGYKGSSGDNETYDFQMILPEDGTDGYVSSTAYYFYVEVS